LRFEKPFREGECGKRDGSSYISEETENKTKTDFIEKRGKRKSHRIRKRPRLKRKRGRGWGWCLAEEGE